MSIDIALPYLQVNFAYSLAEIRKKSLQDALRATISSMDIVVLDKELHLFVNNKYINKLASLGLRGELAFCTPCILSANPYLLAYYRLLLGYSQKTFYNFTGLLSFKSMEYKGIVTEKNAENIKELCFSLNRNMEYLIDKLSEDMISASFFDQLTLLTLGPQLRGGANVERGVSAITDVFNIVQDIVKEFVVESSPKHFKIVNAAGRFVEIQFAPDPDIVIYELLPGLHRYLIAIEVKGGQDYSNIHNRIGEAEKSHQKARKDGYIECWTVVNVDGLDIEKAKKESPSTNRFYSISNLANSSSEEYQDFRLRIISIIGIKQ